MKRFAHYENSCLAYDLDAVSLDPLTIPDLQVAAQLI